jgi:hypothetical protein
VRERERERERESEDGFSKLQLHESTIFFLFFSFFPVLPPRPLLRALHGRSWRPTSAADYKFHCSPPLVTQVRNLPGRCHSHGMALPFSLGSFLFGELPLLFPRGKSTATESTAAHILTSSEISNWLAVHRQVNVSVFDYTLGSRC